MFLLVGVKGQYHKTFDTSFVRPLSVLFAWARSTYALMRGFGGQRRDDKTTMLPPDQITFL